MGVDFRLSGPTLPMELATKFAVPDGAYRILAHLNVVDSARELARLKGKEALDNIVPCPVRSPVLFLLSICVLS